MEFASKSITLFAAISTAMAVSACTQWVPPPGKSEYEAKLDLAHCTNVSEGAAPMSNAPYRPTVQQHSGTVYTPRGPVTYSGTTTDSGAAMANLGDSIGDFATVIVRKDIRESCMHSMGYSKNAN